MPIFLLIRHGENDYVKKGRLAGRKPGVHLNEKGQTQAQALADKLKDAPIKAIYSSPLERAMETAAPIGSALNLKVTPREGLLETEVGEWQDQSLKGLQRLKLWRSVQFTPSQFRFPGGEAFVETQGRIRQEIETLSGQHDPRDLIVCVSHADPIKLAVAFYIGLPLDLFQRLHVSPASITALMVGKHGSQLLNLNYDVSLIFSKP
jgi:probable phosphomutase (TIGR03848 family)